MERSREVKKSTYVDLVCDNCGGIMKINHNTMITPCGMSSDNEYRYVCPDCDSTTLSKTQYPYTKIEFNENTNEERMI